MCRAAMQVNRKAKQTQMYVDGIQLLPAAVSPGNPKPSPATLPPKTPAPTTPAPTTPAPNTPQGTQRLHAAGNGIFTADGAPWRVRGVNVADPRMNTQCGPDTLAAATAEVMRRIDAAVAWGATLLRVPLETAWYDGSDDGLAPAGGSYRDAIQSIAQHVGEHPGVYIMISLFQVSAHLHEDLSGNHFPYLQMKFAKLAARLVICSALLIVWTYPWLQNLVHGEFQRLTTCVRSAGRILHQERSTTHSGGLADSRNKCQVSNCRGFACCFH